MPIRLAPLAQKKDAPAELILRLGYAKMVKGDLEEAERLTHQAITMAKDPAEFAAAEAKLLESQSTFAKLRGDKDKETREWTQALIELYTAWDKAEPGQGHAVQAGEWKTKLEATKK